MTPQEYDYKLIGYNIKQARKSKRYTQEFLAEKIGVGDKHVSNLERGKAGISVDLLIKLCKVLEVDSDYILFGKMTTSPGNPLNILMERLTPQQIMQAERLLEMYASS